MAKMDFSNLSFSLTPTAFMYEAHYSGGSWQHGIIKPYGDIAISPAACVLNYGQGIFEGLKVYGGKDGKAFLFRPEMNARRMQHGCERLCMPPIPEDIFLDGVYKVANSNRDYIPPFQEGLDSQASLYLRPVLWGTGPILGVAPASTFTFIVYASPVGPYFKGGLKPIKLKVSTDMHRAVPGGTGGVKAIGNYAPGMIAARNAKSEGFSEVIYLDAKESKYVEEVGAANFFCLVEDKCVATPVLDGTILPGVTRNSVIELLRSEGFQVIEKKLSIDEVLNAKEAFATGTAAVISPIGTIHHSGNEYKLGDGEQVGEVTKLIYSKLVNIQHGIIEDSFEWRYSIDASS